MVCSSQVCWCRAVETLLYMRELCDQEFEYYFEIFMTHSSVAINKKLDMYDAYLMPQKYYQKCASY